MENNIFVSKYYLVSADEKSYISYTFNTVRDADDYAIKNLRGRGYAGIDGRRVLNMIQKGLIKKLRTHSIAFNAPEPISRLRTRSDIRSNQTSYSSSVISSKDIPPDINSLWQLHAEGTSIDDINDWRNTFGQAGWVVEARPSKRLIGKCDMYIKRDE